jgi:hypothetical protein
MNILIAGGTGLIGNALSQYLVQHNHTVTILSRTPERYSDRANQNLRFVKWDGESTFGWGELINQSEGVVNLTGESLSSKRWSDAQKKRIIDSRIKPAQAIVEAIELADQKPKVLIQVSGVGYYGMSMIKTMTEASPPGDDFASKVCIDWENSIEPVEHTGVRRVILRSAVVLSKQGGALSRMLMPFRFFVGGPLGSGKQWFPWIHIQDEVRAMDFLIHSDQATGPFNLIAPEAVTNAQFAKAIGKVMHRPSFIPVPAFALKAIFGEMSTILLDGQHVIPEKLNKLGFQFTFPTVEEALQNILH